MKISEIYAKYKINKGLQEHMIRVAAVAKQISNHYEIEIDEETIVTACLLHDMGNLLKFKFDVAPELCEPEGVAYWVAAQQEMKEKYGENVHDATCAMIKEISSDPKVNEVTDNASFDVIIQVAETGSLEEKVLEYADMRVGLHGIISVRERFDDIANRYTPHRFTKDIVEERYKACQRMEQEIFANSIITSEDITDESTKDIQAALYNFEIKS